MKQKALDAMVIFLERFYELAWASQTPAGSRGAQNL